MSQTDGSDAPLDEPARSDRGDRDVDPDRGTLLDRGPVGRRTLIKGIGASAAGAFALGSDHGIVDESEAIVPLVLGAAVGGAAVGWALREYNVIGADAPAEGLTSSALEQDVYETARTRKSTNKSTFVDNRNIIQSGLANTLYVEGKLAAIEKLNNQAAKANVETAAQNARANYATTIEKNYLKSWNESVRELENLVTAISDHPELTLFDDFGLLFYDDGTGDNDLNSVESTEVTRTLSDGSEFQLLRLQIGANGATLTYDPDQMTRNVDSGGSVLPEYDGQLTLATDPQISYMSYDDWNGVWSDIQTTVSNVESGLTTWVNNAYEQVQSGAIEVSELITPRERAQMIAEDDGAAQAIADLQALNVPLDVGREVTITQTSTGATIRGTLALTNPDGVTIESGSSYNPSADTWSGGSAYFTYDVATGSGDWSAYEEGVDGGVATFTEEPYESTRYEFTTSSNETVVANRTDFTPVNSTGDPVDPQDATAWEIDLSSKLENDITNLTGVDFFAATDESRYETIQLQSEFSVDSITDRETGEEASSMTFESSQPQDDTNYITQEEWNDLQKQNEQLIEQYKKSQNRGGGGIDLGGLDMFGLPGEIVALAGAGVAALLYGNSR